MTIPAPAFDATLSESALPRIRAVRTQGATYLRAAARACRLVMLYAIVCCVVALALAAAQEANAAGWGLAGDLPAADSPAMQIAPLGVTVELLGKSPREQAAALDRLAAGGVGWVRLRADWAALEPAPGTWAWEELDGIIARFGERGLEPVLVLDNSPPWARAPTDYGAAIAPPQQPQAFARFASTVASRYRGRVRFYQVWDEPNIAPHWGNRLIDPIGYAQLLRAAAGQLRAADGDAVVLTAALAPTNDRGHLAIDEPWFLQRMLAAGAQGSFDAVAVEPFGFGDAPATVGVTGRRLNFQRLALIRKTLLDAGLGKTPVWALRLGWNTRGDSPWATVSQEDQERYAAEARGVAARWPWLATLGWAIDQPATPAADPAWGFALSDGLLAALSGPPAHVTLPDGAGLARTLLVLAATGLLALVVAWPSVRGISVDSLRWRWRNLPLWLQAGVWVGLIGVYHLATWPPLIVACVAAGALLAAAAPQVALWIALASLPFYYRHKEIALGAHLLIVPPLVTSAAILAPVTALCGWRAWRMGEGAWRRLVWADWAAAAWLVLGLLASAHVWHWAGYARGMLEIVVAPLILYAATRLFTRGPAATRRAMVALFCGGLLVAVVGLVRWLGGDGVAIDGVRRLVGPHFSPNHTALYLLRTLFVGVGLALGVHGRQRTIWLAMTALTALALLLTASRGALLLGLPAGIATCVWLWLLRGDLPPGERVRAVLRHRPVRVLLASAPFLIVAAAALGEARLLNAASVDSRLVLWRSALQLATDYPLLGAGGPGGYFWRYAAYLPLGTLLEPGLLHPHNVWLEMATGWGALGVLWLVVVTVRWLASAAGGVKSSEPSLQWPAIGLTAALVAALAHAQVDAFLVLPDLAGWLFAALGLQQAIFRRRNPQAS